jgi:hypothetical protein
VQRNTQEAAVLQADRQKLLDDNAAWQSQVIEAFGICPFARQCREEGRLHRDVIDATGAALPDALKGAIAALQSPENTREIPWQVVLLLCPFAPHDPRLFERQVQDAADRVRADLQASGQALQYHVVAFHPQMAWSAQDPGKLVAFWRRSPHPTVQLVHIATLERLRGAKMPPRYVDPDDLDAIAALVGQTVTADLADRIAQANWRTFHAQHEQIQHQLAALAAKRRPGGQ